MSVQALWALWENLELIWAGWADHCYADEFADRPEEVEGSSQIQVGNADGSDAEKEDTKGSDTAQWMGQVETDETKLQDNQLEYSELYTLISRYNPTIEQSLTSFNQSLEDYVNAWEN